MMTVNEIFAEDGRNPPAERSLPWEESRDGLVVVVEPKPHWASDMAAFRLTDRAWCYYADWCANGPGARFFGHPDTRGDEVMMRSRAMIARELAEGLWVP